MNKSSIVLLVAIIIVSMAVGAAATRVNYRILPSGPIVVTPQVETNQTSIKINKLNITSLATGTVATTPHPYLVYSNEKTYKQGNLLGISLIYSFTWTNLPPIEPNFSSVGGGTEEYIYFGEKLSAHFVTTLQILSADGWLAADEGDLNMLTSGGQNQGTSTRTYFVQVSFNWTPRTYTIRVQVEDLLTKLEDSQETTITILAGLPHQEQHPSPIATEPKDMIIGPADLPEGWNITSEDSSYSPLEDIVASFQRSFSKTVGDYKNTFDVRIIQFENTEKANSSFYSRLDMCLSNQMYGHGKVVMESLADGCFLYDNDERRSLNWTGWLNWDGGSAHVNASDWATGSIVIFVRQNIIVCIGDSYNYGALSQGIFITPDQLIDFARIQATTIS